MVQTNEHHIRTKLNDIRVKVPDEGSVKYNGILERDF